MSILTIYEPFEDSYLLADQVKKHAFGQVLDMGSGSGIQAETALTSKKVKSVLCTDLDGEAVTLLRKKGLSAKQSDLFFRVDRKFDTIIFNPPYLPQDDYRAIDRTTIGGERGNEVINFFLKDAKRYLERDGKILVIFSSLTPGVVDLFRRYGYQFKKLSEEKLFFETLYTYMLY